MKFLRPGTVETLKVITECLYLNFCNQNALILNDGSVTLTVMSTSKEGDPCWATGYHSLFIY
jgi:hypothetical protein